MQNWYSYGIDRLSYIDEGNGPITILLIHGFGEDYQVWNSQIAFLSQHFRIIAPNLPGIHCKPLPIHHTETPNIRLYVNVMHELMHHLQIEQYYVIGHSMGGYIGLEFADYYINHVIGLGLVHSTTYADSDAKKQSRIKVAEFLETNGTGKYIETATPNLFGPSFKLKHPERIQALMDAMIDVSSDAMIQFVMAMKNRKQHIHLLKQNRIPVWMIIGDADIAVPLHDSIEQAKLLPTGNVLILKGVGHMGMIEAPDQVNQAIFQFINNNIHTSI